MTDDGVRVDGPMNDRYDEVLTDAALGFLAGLHRAFDGRRRELLDLRGQRYAELAAGGSMDFLAETKDVREDAGWRVAEPAPGLVDRRAEITGPTDRKMTVNALNSGSSMKEYTEPLRDDPSYAGRAARFAATVRDVSEVLNELGPVAERHPLPVTVAYHDACHLAHAQGVRAQPRALLRAIPGLELREIADPEICCGSAGIYNLLHPGPAGELGERKARDVLATGAQVMVTANPGCLMQVASSIGRLGGDVALAHTVEVLDASLRGRSVDAMTRDLALARP